MFPSRDTPIVSIKVTRRKTGEKVHRLPMMKPIGKVRGTDTIHHPKDVRRSSLQAIPPATTSQVYRQRVLRPWTFRTTYETQENPPPRTNLSMFETNVPGLGLDQSYSTINTGVPNITPSPGPSTTQSTIARNNGQSTNTHYSTFIRTAMGPGHMQPSEEQFVVQQHVRKLNSAVLLSPSEAQFLQEAYLQHKEVLPATACSANPKPSSGNLATLQPAAKKPGSFGHMSVLPVNVQFLGRQNFACPSILKQGVNGQAPEDRNEITLMNFRNAAHATSRLLKVPERLERIGNEGREGKLAEWATRDATNGYIEHPEAGPMMHPSFYDNLCPYPGHCIHDNVCWEIRVLMAVRNYNLSPSKTTYRDQELIWGVSRSTIQRKKVQFDKRAKLHSGSTDFPFILRGFRLSEQ